MNSAFDEIKEALRLFGKKASLINENYNDLIYKGKPLLQNFDNLLSEAIDLSQQLYSDINSLKDIVYSPNAPQIKKQQYEEMNVDFFKFIDQIQDIQTKIIERKKENLKSYNKSLHHRKRSQISGLRSQMSLGTANNLGESKMRDKSFTTAQNDKTESFVRFSNQNSEYTPNNRLMYQESGGSSMLEDESQQDQDLSELDLSGDPNTDFEKIQKAAAVTEHEINDQQNKLNIMQEIQKFLKQEQEYKEQQKLEEEQRKKDFHSYSSGGLGSHKSSLNIANNSNAIKPTNTNTTTTIKNQKTIINQQSVVINQSNLANQSTIVYANNYNASVTQGDVYIQIKDHPAYEDNHDQGTSYEQSKKKKYIILAIILIIIAAAIAVPVALFV